MRSIVLTLSLAVAACDAPNEERARREEAPSEVLTVDEEFPTIDFFVNAARADEIALTFDDGPDRGGHTLRVLDVLAAKGVRATFFINTANADDVRTSPVARYAIARMVAEGHRVGNHSARHLDFRDLSVDVARELADVDEILRTIAPRALETRLVRTPFGAPFFFTRTRLDEVTPHLALHGVHVGWNIDSADWRCDGAAACVRENVLRDVDEGRSGVVLLHSTLPATAEALPSLIEALRARGKRFIDVEQLVIEKYGLPSRHLVHCRSDGDCSEGDACGIAGRCVTPDGAATPIAEPEPTPPPAGWHAMTEPPLSPRVDVATAWDGRRLFVYGGRDAWVERYHADGAVYDAYDGAWRALPKSPIAARAGAVAVTHEQQLYVLGGANADHDALRSAAVYSLAIDRWAFLPPSPRPVHCGARGAFSPATDELIVFGCVWNGARYEAGGFALRPGTGQWRAIATPPLSARTGFAFGVVRDRIVVWGGADRSSTAPTRADGALYDPIADRWSPLPPAPITARAEPHALVVDDRFVVFGGVTTGAQSALADGAVYEGGAWTPIPRNAAAHARRRFAATFAVGGWLFVIGGNAWSDGAEGELRTDGYRYDFASEQWTALDGPLSERRRAIAVSNAHLALLWGGDWWGNARMDGARLGLVTR